MSGREIDLNGVPAEMRERLADWVALAETGGAVAVIAKLAEQNERLHAALARDASAAERLLRD